jgi:hypothetical protein
MRQQFPDSAVGRRRQPLEHILQIGEGLVSVQARRLNQTHDGGRALPRAQAAGKLNRPGFGGGSPS